MCDVSLVQIHKEWHTTTHRVRLTTSEQHGLAAQTGSRAMLCVQAEACPTAQLSALHIPVPWDQCGYSEASEDHCTKRSDHSAVLAQTARQQQPRHSLRQWQDGIIFQQIAKSWLALTALT